MLTSETISRASALAAAFVVLFVYLYTLAPSVTWKHNGADSGDLATAAYSLGIPHPPGYPLFTLIAALFARLPTFEPAGGVAILSAIAGALTVFVLARASAALIAPLSSGLISALLPAIGAVLFGFTPALWSQATLAEVYTLNLLFASVIIWAMIVDTPQRVPIAAAAFGFGLAHHLSVVLLAPGALLALRPGWRDWRASLLVISPLVFYAYLPLRAPFNPPLNWGNPSTPEGFIWEVTAAPYRAYLFRLNFSDVVARALYSARLVFDQFTLPGVALGLWGLISLAVAKKRLAVALGTNALLVIGYAVTYASRDSFIYLLPVFAIFLLFIIYGAASIPELFRSGHGEKRPTSLRSMIGVLPQAIVVLVLGLIAAYSLTTNLSAMDLSSDRQAFNYARNILDRLPRDAVVFAEGDDDLFALIYYRFAVLEDRSSAVIVSQGLLQYEWYYENLRRTMSEVILAPASVKTDFHQRAVEIASVAFAEGRTVCSADPSPTLPEFEYETRGPVRCIIGQKE